MVPLMKDNTKTENAMKCAPANENPQLQNSLKFEAGLPVIYLGPLWCVSDFPEME